MKAELEHLFAKYWPIELLIEVLIPPSTTDMSRLLAKRFTSETEAVFK
jgi:hypothetical protein